MIADADTGYGNPLNVIRTVGAYEAAGVAAMHLEDQVAPKKCGHMEGKLVIPAEEMAQKIRAAVDARTRPDFMIIARTDARAVEGLEAALDRARLYREAGADALFIEARDVGGRSRRNRPGLPGRAAAVQLGRRREDPADQPGPAAGTGLPDRHLPDQHAARGDRSDAPGAREIARSGTPAGLLADLPSFGDFWTSSGCRRSARRSSGTALSGEAGRVHTAFVLGGGGILGAHEVGMLRALSEAGIRPDVVVGTSVGAINGALLAADPAGAAARLAGLWQGDELQQAFSESVWGRLARLVRSGTHLHSLEPLERMLDGALPGKDFADLELPFHCVAASIEHASARWFTAGPIVPAVLASCAVPGLLPPVEVDGEHYFDGGLVDSIPVGRAVGLGASTIYVLHVGRIERPLTVPRRPWEVGLVAFEIARRHRFHEEMSALPSSVTVHVLPSGGDPRPPDLSQLRYRDRTKVGVRIEQAYLASASYLARLAGS